MTIYDLPETIPLDEEGHVDDHITIHKGLKDHETRIGVIETGKSDISHKHSISDVMELEARLIAAERQDLAEFAGILTNQVDASEAVVGMEGLSGTFSLSSVLSGINGSVGDVEAQIEGVNSQISNLEASKAPVNHNHEITEVNGLRSELDSALDRDASLVTGNFTSDVDITKARVVIDGTTETMEGLFEGLGVVLDQLDAIDLTQEGRIEAIEGTIQGHDSNISNLQSVNQRKANLIDGKIPTSELPAIALTKPHSVANRAGMLALVAEEGDVAIVREGSDKGTYMLGDGPSNRFESWMSLATSADGPVQSVNGQIGTINLSYSDVGAAPASHNHTIGNVTGLQAELSTKADISGGKLIESQLPASATSAAHLTGALSSVNIGAGTVSGTRIDSRISSINGSISTLDSRVSTTESNISTLTTTMDEKADWQHIHTIAQVSGLSTALNNAATVTQLNNKIQLVTSFPTNPTQGVLYVKAED